MGYVDLRRRRDGRDPRKPAGSPQSHPYLLLAVGFVLGTFVLPVFYIAFNGSEPFGVLLLLIATVTLLRYLGRRLPKPASARSSSGAEKQLLMAILDSRGLTPVEAALKTSLTVDEAEEILTRLADRGHLLLQSSDGTLSYALPGRYSPSTHAPDSIRT